MQRTREFIPGARGGRKEEQIQEMQTKEKVKYDSLVITKGAKIGNDKMIRSEAEISLIFFFFLF